MLPNKDRFELTARYFSGITEQTFQSRLGVADPPLVDYLSRLLVRFIHRDGLYSVRAPSGRRLKQVTEMMAEAEQRSGRSRREVHRHIGDFTLFWTGVYPEALEKLSAPPRTDSFIDYRTQGKRSYMIAAEVDLAPEPSESPSTEEAGSQQSELLHKLSEEYELCAFGLSEVRKEWERKDGEDGPQSLWIA
ncbi:MAG: hypothetical protein MPJ50_17540 [Pirellulales bacterium]|nr:hypothetical protein [Pirellulales bacterium]